jgi:hypothetical protein
LDVNRPQWENLLADRDFLELELGLKGRTATPSRADRFPKSQQVLPTRHCRRIGELGSNRGACRMYAQFNIHGKIWEKYYKR